MATRRVSCIRNGHITLLNVSSAMAIRLVFCTIYYAKWPHDFDERIKRNGHQAGIRIMYHAKWSLIFGGCIRPLNLHAFIRRQCRKVPPASASRGCWERGRVLFSRQCTKFTLQKTMWVESGANGQCGRRLVRCGNNAVACAGAHLGLKPTLALARKHNLS